MVVSRGSHAKYVGLFEQISSCRELLGQSQSFQSTSTREQHFRRVNESSAISHEEPPRIGITNEEPSISSSAISHEEPPRVGITNEEPSISSSEDYQLTHTPQAQRLELLPPPPPPPSSEEKEPSPNQRCGKRRQGKHRRVTTDAFVDPHDKEDGGGKRRRGKHRRVTTDAFVDPHDKEDGGGKPSAAAAELTRQAAELTRQREAPSVHGKGRNTVADPSHTDKLRLFLWSFHCWHWQHAQCLCQMSRLQSAQSTP